jgi:general secretion pathway protein H
MKRLSSPSGLSLMEMMVVLGLLAGMAAYFAPKLFKPNDANMKSVVRKLGSLVREARLQARLKNQTYRIVFDLDPEKGSYWAEVATGPTLAIKENGVVDKKESKKSDSDKEDQPEGPFSLVTNLTKTKRPLPSGMAFSSFESGVLKETFRSGKVFLYISPEGLVEFSALQITDPKKHTWTLIFHPLTGQAEIVDHAINLKDAHDKME